MLNTNITILLVESEKADYEFIQNLLSRVRGTQYDLRWSQSIEATQHLLVDGEYDICLLDARLSENGGLERVRQILSVRSNIPIILLTADDDAELLDAVVPTGIADYLAKSQLSAELVEHAVRHAIEYARIEAALQQTSGKYTFLIAAIENLSIGVFVTDPRLPENPLIFVNSAFTSITGYKLEEAEDYNQHFLENLDENSLISESVHAFNDAIRQRLPYKGVLLHKRKNGTLQRNSVNVSPVFNEQGELIHFVGLLEDVTAHHEAQEVLRHSKKHIEGIVANVPGMIYRVLRYPDSSKFVYVSEGCRDLFGIEPQQFLEDAQTLRSLVHPDDLPGYIKSAAVATESLHPKPWRWRGRFLLPWGEEKICVAWGNPLLQENGTVIWDGLLMDVTQQMQTEQKAAQLASIVECSTDAIFSVTLDDLITSWNAAAETMYGYTADEIIGQPVGLLLPPNRTGEIETLRASIERGEQVQSYETVRRKKDGSLFHAELTVSPIQDRAGKLVSIASIVHDITERKASQAQIERQIQRIQALRNIDMAISGSVDLRVTLNIVLDQVTTHLNVDSAAVLLFNTHTQRLEYAAGRGFRTTALQRTELHMGEGYAGRAALEQRVMTIPNSLKTTSDFVRTPLLVGEDFDAYCAIPLITKGRIEGVLEIFHRAPLNISNDWLSFLETLAGQAAIAIENADLFNDLQHSNLELQAAYDNTLEGWSRALDLRDQETEGHTQRVTAHVMRLARAMKIARSELIHLRRGALLHDIGKMGIPDSILLKPGPLTEEEWSRDAPPPGLCLRTTLAHSAYLRSGPGHSILPSRKMGRQWLSARPQRRANSAQRAHLRCGGCLGRAEFRSSLSRGLARR